MSQANLKKTKSPGDAPLTILNADAELDSFGRDLHKWMQKLCIGRQKETGFGKKAKWALYEQSHFEKLIKDITELVSNLVELFPATQQIQRLCDQEVSELDSQSTSSLSNLQDITDSQNKELAAAISKALDSNKSNTWVNNNSKVGMQIGTSNVYGIQHLSFQ